MAGRSPPIVRVSALHPATAAAQPRRASSERTASRRRSTSASSASTRRSTLSTRCGGRSGRNGRLRRLAVPGRVAEEVPVALLLLPRPAVEALDEVSPDQRVERLEDVAEIVEPVKSLRPLLQLSRRLRAPEHQDAEHRRRVPLEPELLVEELPVLRRPAPRPARDACPAAARQTLQRVVDLPLVVVDDRVAVRRLVAGEPERVESERVLVGRRALLLEQAAEHAELDCVGVHARSVRHPIGPVSATPPSGYGGRVTSSSS